MKQVLHGFYADNLERVAMAIAYRDESCGEVTDADGPVRASKGRWVFPIGSLFSQKIFGPIHDHRCACGTLDGREHDGATCERCGTLCGSAELRRTRFGHVCTGPCLHPAAYDAIAAALGWSRENVELLAHAERVLDGDELVPLEEGPDDAPLPVQAIARLLRAHGAEHLLTFVGIEQVPVPPAAERPFVEAGTRGPEMVHPSIGPLNELWRRFVTQAKQDRRLAELEAPPIIRLSQAGRTQELLDEIWAATREPPSPAPARAPRALPHGGRLVPPLLPPVDAPTLPFEIAVVGERLVVQRQSGVQVLDATGRLLFDLPPAGCLLKGALDERIVVFVGYLRHPGWCDDHGFGPDHVRELDDGSLEVSPVCGEITCLDVVEGHYLEHAPPGLPTAWIEHAQPEELGFADADPLMVGGDRPSVLAMSPGLDAAWVGAAEDSQIVDMKSGAPHATPCPDPEVERVLDVRTGEVTPHDEDEVDDIVGGACAVAFAKGRWWLFSELGVLSDQDGVGAVRFVPDAYAVSFTADATKLAMLYEEHVVWVDVETLEVTAVPLP